MAIFWLTVLVLVNRSLGDYACALRSLELTCTGIFENIPSPLSATVNKTFIMSVSIANAKIPYVTRATFRDFGGNLETVSLNNAGVVEVRSDAFSSNGGLKFLSLRDNGLAGFNASCPALLELDLSVNLIDDLSGFDVGAHPHLRVLNVSYNMLAYLPNGILDKLEEKNDFFVIVDNNPWNCSHPRWTDRLSPKLMYLFCTDQSFNRNYKMTERVADEARRYKPTVCDENLICWKCSYTFCLVWLFGGVWLGVILGNVGKLRLLICGRVPMFADKHTQCDYTLIDQHMISAVFDYKRRKLIPISATGTISSHHRASETVRFFKSGTAEAAGIPDGERDDDNDDNSDGTGKDIYIYSIGKSK